MGTTTRGLPYPEPSDPVAAGADAIKSLAAAVDSMTRTGVAAITVGASGGLYTVNFPTAFAAAPVVVMVPLVASGGPDLTTYLFAVTAANFQGRLLNGGALAAPGYQTSISWIAVGRIA